jgi:hypothetical protein
MEALRRPCRQAVAPEAAVIGRSCDEGGITTRLCASDRYRGNQIEHGEAVERLELDQSPTSSALEVPRSGREHATKQ